MQERIIRGLVEGYGVASVSSVTSLMHSIEICRRNFDGLWMHILKMYEVKRLGL